MLAASLQKLHAAVDRRDSELVSVQPMQGGDYLAAAPSGAAAEIQAYVTDTARPVRTSGNAANSGHNPELRGATHTARFATSALAFTVEDGAVVTRLAAPGTPSYRVVGVLPFGTDRTVLLMVEA